MRPPPLFQNHRGFSSFFRQIDLQDLYITLGSGLEYWRDGDWYVGRLMEVPGVFSQGESLDELRENIQEAYELMVTQDRTAAPPFAERQDVELEV
jgi:predicted RNase H-like HicB family nuclease